MSFSSATVRGSNLAVVRLAEERDLLLALVQGLVECVDLMFQLLAAGLRHAQLQARLLGDFEQRRAVLERLRLTLRRLQALAPVHVAGRGSDAQRGHERRRPEPTRMPGATE